jgi:hypothetical protein
MTRTKAAMLPAVVALAAALLACGGDSPAAGPTGAGTTSPTPSPRPSSSGQLSILGPKDGDVVKGSTVTLKVGLEGATLVPFTSQNLKPNEGHLHVLLDGRLISMTQGLEQEIKDVAAGAHVIRVEFVANDHVPFDPRVVQEVTFTVE